MKLAQSAVIVGLFSLQGCADWKPTTATSAPDRKTVAQIEVSLAGTPAGNFTRIVLKNGPGGELPKPVIVVEAHDAIVGFTRLSWLDSDHLHVRLCDATYYTVRTENLRDPGYLDSGKGDGVGIPNAVWVEVKNLRYSETTKACEPRGKLK